MAVPMVGKCVHQLAKVRAPSIAQATAAAGSAGQAAARAGVAEGSRHRLGWSKEGS